MVLTSCRSGTTLSTAAKNSKCCCWTEWAGTPTTMMMLMTRVPPNGKKLRSQLLISVKVRDCIVATKGVVSLEDRLFYVFNLHHLYNPKLFDWSLSSSFAVHPGFSAEKCFKRIDSGLRAMLSKRHLPKVSTMLSNSSCCLACGTTVKNVIAFSCRVSKAAWWSHVHVVIIVGDPPIPLPRCSGVMIWRGDRIGIPCHVRVVFTLTKGLCANCSSLAQQRKKRFELNSVTPLLQGTLACLEEEITGFFKLCPSSIFVSQLPSSYERLLMHALCQYLDLRSKSECLFAHLWGLVGSQSAEQARAVVLRDLLEKAFMNLGGEHERLVLPCQGKNTFWISTCFVGSFSLKQFCCFLFFRLWRWPWCASNASWEQKRRFCASNTKSYRILRIKALTTTHL